MYHIGRKVIVKSVGNRLGVITEANYVTLNGKRKAHYLVNFIDGGGNNGGGGNFSGDFLTGSDDLRAHDYFCDGCGQSRNGPPIWAHEEAGNYCFICKVDHERNQYHDYDRYMHEGVW